MQIIIEKDTATRIAKDCTREEAEVFAASFPVNVVINAEGHTQPWTEWSEANPVEAANDADEQDDTHQDPVDEKAVIDSLLKRHSLSKSAFKKLPADRREKMIVEETALIASEAEA